MIEAAQDARRGAGGCATRSSRRGSSTGRSRRSSPAGCSGSCPARRTTSSARSPRSSTSRIGARRMTGVFNLLDGELDAGAAQPGGPPLPCSVVAAELARDADRLGVLRARRRARRRGRTTTSCTRGVAARRRRRGDAADARRASACSAPGTSCASRRARGAHSVRNAATAPARFAMASSKEESRSIVYPDSDKVGRRPGLPADREARRGRSSTGRASRERVNLFDVEVERRRRRSRRVPHVRTCASARWSAAEQLGLSVYELPPGPEHLPVPLRDRREEWLIVLSGEPTLRTPKASSELGRGTSRSSPTGEDGRAQGDEPTDETRARRDPLEQAATPASRSIPTRTRSASGRRQALPPRPTRSTTGTASSNRRTCPGDSPRDMPGCGAHRRRQSPVPVVTSTCPGTVPGTCRSSTSAATDAAGDRVVRSAMARRALRSARGRRVPRDSPGVAGMGDLQRRRRSPRSPLSSGSRRSLADWHLLACCLMPNHFHLVVLRELERLSRGMHLLNFRYAQRSTSDTIARPPLPGSLRRPRRRGDEHLVNVCEYVARQRRARRPLRNATTGPGSAASCSTT